MILDFIVRYSVNIALIMRLTSCIIILIFAIPLQIREAGVKNGLKPLRLQLLAIGLILFFINIVSIIFLITIYDITQKPINASLQIINAIAFFLIAILGQSIYHKQYSNESKSDHRQIQKMRNER